MGASRSAARARELLLLPFSSLEPRTLVPLVFLWSLASSAWGQTSLPPVAEPQGPGDEANPVQEVSEETPEEAPEETPAPVSEDHPVAPPTEPEDDLTAIENALEADRQSAPPAQGPSPAPLSPARSFFSAVQSMNPELALVADVALAWFSTPENLQAGGHDPTRNGFNLQQLELSLGAAVDPYFRFDANLVFTLFGVEVEEAYASTLGLPGGFQVRLGQFLTRFGRINATHPHSWDFVDQPFSLGRVFGGEGNRGLGAELSWLTPLPWYVELVGSVTTAAGGGSARSFYGNEDLGVRTPLDFLSIVALKQFFPLSPSWSLALGCSGAFGPNSTGRDNRSEVYGVDLFLKWLPPGHPRFLAFHLTSEWFYRRRQVPADVHQDVEGYAALFFRFDQRWATAARYEYGSPALDRQGALVVDDLDPEWSDHRHRASWNITFSPTEFSRLRLQAIVDLPQWESKPIWAGVLAAEFVAGAHGAHAF